MSSKVMIGVVKLFEKETGRGVISPKNVEGISDLYFAANPQAQFKAGQMVKFVTDESSSRALEVAVLSESY